VDEPRAMIAEHPRAKARHVEILSDVLCDVDGTRLAYEAVRQAASLAAPEGRLALLAVTNVTGSGAWETAELSPAVARRALDRSRRLARQAGVASTREIAPSGGHIEVLLARARHHTLLALGAPSMSRLGQLLVGGAATAAAHALPASLLIARPPPTGHGFAERVMVASDALAHSDPLIDFAVDLARTRRASLVLFHAARAESGSHPTRISAQAERLSQALGERASVRVAAGRTHQVIIEAAEQERVSLLVLASRRLTGPRAIGSACERVIHDAPCSVLVLRPEDVQR
jgi:nucleotide-binding universal stress UspA family protein